MLCPAGDGGRPGRGFLKVRTVWGFPLKSDPLLKQPHKAAALEITTCGLGWSRNKPPPPSLSPQMYSHRRETDSVYRESRRFWWLTCWFSTSSESDYRRVLLRVTPFTAFCLWWRKTQVCDNLQVQGRQECSVACADWDSLTSVRTINKLIRTEPGSAVINDLII